MDLVLAKIDCPGIRMGEYELLTSAQQGNLDAFNQLVLKHQQDVYNLAFWIVKDSQTAEDITQETFLKAFQWINQFKGGSFRGWLFRVAKNACIDEIRHQNRHQFNALMPIDGHNDEEIETPTWMAEPGSVQNTVENREFYQAMRLWIQSLPANYSIPIILIDIMTMNYEEAAKVMHVPVGTIKSRVSRTRSYLRKQIKLFHRDTFQHTNEVFPAVTR